jgi:hypothetical protein
MSADWEGFVCSQSGKHKEGGEVEDRLLTIGLACIDAPEIDQKREGTVIDLTTSVACWRSDDPIDSPVMRIRLGKKMTANTMIGRPTNRAVTKAYAMRISAIDWVMMKSWMVDGFSLRKKPAICTRAAGTTLIKSDEARQTSQAVA